MAARILAWAALAAVLVLGGPVARAVAKPRVVTRTIGPPGPEVPRSFAGFSIEYDSAFDYVGRPGAPNAPFIELLRTLGSKGVGIPTLHLGGNSADETWWNPDGKPRPAGIDTDVTPAFLSALRAASEQAGSQVVLGGDLAIADPANQVSFIQAAGAALPPGALLAYEIGNEPDLYGRSVTFQVGGKTITRIQHRPANYEMPQYLAELDGYLSVLNAARVPGWPSLAVGGFARNAWQVQAPAVLDHVAGKGVGYFQAHAYPLNRCRAAHPPVVRWRRALLGPTGSLPVARVTRLVRDVRGRGAAVRVSELNSATCGGASGVSDSFAAALWSADVLFGMVQGGVAGVNFHTWSGAWYAPIDFSAGAARVRPLLYGILFFDRAVQNGARLLRVSQRRSDRVKIWATRDLSSTVRVAVINKDPRHARTVRLRLPRGLASGTLERLVARSLGSRSGVTFGGRSFERGVFDGLLHGTRRGTRVRRHGRTYELRMPAASAALLTVQHRAARS